MHVPNFLGLPILKINKAVMYEFWYDYINPKYQEKPNLSYMGTDSFIVNIKTGDVYEDIASNVEKIFNISIYVAERPLPIRFLKHKLGGMITSEFVKPGSKQYSFFNRWW